MVSLSSVSPSSWRPTTRTLGALFAGSAVTLSATVAHGGSLLDIGGETDLAAEPSATTEVTSPPQQLPPITATAPFSEPGQAMPWAPGATPQWSSPLKDLPVRRAPVIDAARHRDPVTPASVAATSTTPSGSAPSEAHPAAPEGGAASAPTGTTEVAPQAADSPRAPVNGLLGSVVGVTSGISR